jgi:glucosamine-6-phosphate deaminase
MDIYQLGPEELERRLGVRATVVADIPALNRRVAAEFADLLEEKTHKGEMLTIIAPVGPLDYRFFVREVVGRGLSCRALRVVNMDEYLGRNDLYIPRDHPLSFHRFMEETFFHRLPEAARPLAENLHFPDPTDPQRTSRLLEEAGGADICWAGFGITGHVAFNDPPAMIGEPDDLDSFRTCTTRTLTISEASHAQMAMGGTNGNWEIIPKRAVTLGMRELLSAKRLHLTFMRNWHAGLWRRALFGPIITAFPGSLVQDHPNLEVTMTELAARPPLINTSQATGEDE